MEDASGNRSWHQQRRGCNAGFASLLAFGLLAVIFLVPGPSTVGADVYFSSDQYDGFGLGKTIARSKLEPDRESIFHTALGVNGAFVDLNYRDPFGVAADGSHVYWVNHGNGTMGRANSDGSNIQRRFISGLGFPEGMAIDGGHIYWASGHIRIGRANLDGTGVNHDFIVTQDDETTGVAVAGGYVYWTDYSGTIGRANLDGTGVKQNFISGGSGSSGIAVDAGHIYWTNRDAGTIGRANLDGSGVKQDFISGASKPRGIAVDSAHLYWTNPEGFTIGRANLDGSSVDQAFIPSGRANGLAVNGGNLYWAETIAQLIGRATVGGTGLDHDFISGEPDIGNSNLLDLDVDAEHIYWSTIFGIGRANIDGSDPNPGFIRGGGGWPVAVDDEHIYWSPLPLPSDPQVQSIARSDLDGTNVNPDFITGVSAGVDDGVRGIATSGSHIYWTNTGYGTIGRANLDGSGVKQDFITGADDPEGVAVDGSYVYWTNYSGTIGRAKLDGSAVNQAFIANAGYPRQLEVTDDHIYWANWGAGISVLYSDGVGRANIDGSDVDKLYITPFRRIFGLAVDPPPETTIQSGPTGLTKSASPSFAFTSSEPDSTFQCQIDAQVFVSCASPQGYSDLADGPHTFSVRAIDGTDNLDPTPATRSWTFDGTPPSASITKHPPARLNTSRNKIRVAFAVTTEPGARLLCKLDSARFASCTSPRRYRVGAGPHTFRVRATDPVGNVGSPKSFSFRVIRKRR